MSQKKLLCQDECHDCESFDTIMMFESERPKDNRSKAILFANGTAVCGAVYTIGIKLLLAAGMTLLDAIFLRQVGCLAIDYTFMRWNGKSISEDLDTPFKRKMAMYRTICACTVVIAFMVSLNLIPLSIITLGMNAVGFQASLIGYFCFGDRLSAKEIASICACYIGIVFIVLGGNSSEHQDQTDDYRMVLGMLLVLVQSLGLAGVLVFSRYLRDTHSTVLQCHFDITLMLVSIVAVAAQKLLWAYDLTLLSYDYTQYFQMLVFSGVYSMFFLTMTIASQLEKAGPVTLVFQTQILYAFLADVFLFKYSFSALQILGGIVILGTNAVIAC